MHESVEGYRSYFHGIVGFFVCEDHVMRTSNGLITRGHLDEVWTAASARIMSTLQVPKIHNRLNFCGKPELKIYFEIHFICICFFSPSKGWSKDTDALFKYRFYFRLTPPTAQTPVSCWRYTDNNSILQRYNFEWNP